jgi:hypothetical protein
MNMSKNITIEHFKNYLRTLTAYKTLMQRITAGEIQVESSTSKKLILEVSHLI